MSLAKWKVQSVLYFEAPTSSFTFFGLAESLEVHVKMFLRHCKASQILKTDDEVNVIFFFLVQWKICSGQRQRRAQL